MAFSLPQMYMIKRAALLATFLFFPIMVRCATITSLSAGYFDVSNAVYQSSIGDVVIVPAGGATWTNVLIITNGIQLIGAGTNATFITNAIPLASPWSVNLRPPLIWLKITNDTAMRISRFYFYCNYTSGGQGIYANNLTVAGSPIIHALRIDNCIFERATSRAIEVLGSIYGVIDHCLFRNCDLVTEPCSGHDTEWNRFTAPYYGLGGTNTLVVESCSILFDANMGSSQTPIACGQGGHYVWRYNTITNTGIVNSGGLDLHGNNYYYGNDAPYYTNTSQPGWRGSIWLECYSNTWSVGSHQFRGLYVRGGTSVIYGNRFYGTRDSSRIILTEEEGWLTDTFSPLRTNWPAQDQITNSFIWGNYLNDVESNLVVLNHANDSTFIQVNRDYWTRAPQAGDLLADYTPLIFPHPLILALTDVVSYPRQRLGRWKAATP